MSGNQEQSSGRPGQLAEEAAMWFARMRGPEADAHRAAFEAWLARGALHRGAYNRAAEIFSMGKFLENETPKAATLMRPWMERRPALAALAGAGVTALAAAALFIWQGTNAIPGTAREQSAATSEAGDASPPLAMLELASSSSAKVERLIDGSRLTLGPNSRAKVRLDAERRTIWLERGRARFEVAHEARPFAVFAQGTQVVARGTIFDVAIMGSRVSVKLVQGAVDVTQRSAGAGTAERMRLRPGQSVIVASSPAVSSESQNRPDAASALKQAGPILDFDRARLADVTAKANRSGAVPIRFADLALGELRVSGSFRVDDSATLAERLARVLDLEVDRTNPDQIVLSRRR
jgi:transmembrane sensor